MIATIIDDKTIIYTFTKEDLDNQNFNKALSKIRNIAKCNVNKKGETVTITLKDKPQNSTTELGQILDEIREILQGDVIFEYEDKEIIIQEEIKDPKTKEIIQPEIKTIEKVQKPKDLKDNPCLKFTPHPTQTIEPEPVEVEPEKIKEDEVDEPGVQESFLDSLRKTL
jgi:hypothetical protein